MVLHTMGVFNLGYGELLLLLPFLIIIIFIFSIFSRSRRGAGPTLVLKEFQVYEEPDNGIYVKIVGRASGIVAWILTTMGFDTLTSLIVTNKGISFQSSSLLGETIHIAPLTSIASSFSGFMKPIGYIILGVMFILGGFMFGLLGFFFGLIIGVVLFYVYSLKKLFIVTIETHGSMKMGLIFKRSVIENVAVDINLVQKAITVINDQILMAQKK